MEGFLKALQIEKSKKLNKRIHDVVNQNLSSLEERSSILRF